MYYSAWKIIQFWKAEFCIAKSAKHREKTFFTTYARASLNSIILLYYNTIFHTAQQVYFVYVLCMYIYSTHRHRHELDVNSSETPFFSDSAGDGLIPPNMKNLRNEQRDSEKRKL